MTPSHNTLVLGVDGGGTKTAAWICDRDAPADSPPLGKGLAGPGNPRAAGFAAALSNLEVAIAAAFQDASLPPSTVAAACLALAGADRPTEQAILKQWAEERKLAHRLLLTNDAEPLLAAVTPRSPRGADEPRTGVVLIAGTGSIAWGRGPTGTVGRCGGWGYLLGDEGSGYAIALAGLRAATRAADQRDPPTLLLERFQQRLGVDRPAGLIETIYQPTFHRQDLAELASVVFQAADDEDPAALRIIASAGAELAELVRTLVQTLALPPAQFPLALGGGVLLAQSRLREDLAAELHRAGHLPQPMRLVNEAVRGAVELARDASTRTVA